MGLARTKRHSRLLHSLVISVSILLFSMLPQTVFAVNVTYTYDAAGRLLTAQYGDGQHVAYSYDAVGNMTQRMASGFGGGSLGAAVIQLLLGNGTGGGSFSSVLN